jgi:hypothetical protein
MKFEVASDGGKYQTEREGASERARARKYKRERWAGVQCHEAWPATFEMQRCDWQPRFHSGKALEL